MTQITVELPDQIAEQLKAFLANNPNETVASLIQDSIYVKQFPKDSSRILELAGFVTEESDGEPNEHSPIMQEAMDVPSVPIPMTDSTLREESVQK